MKKAALPATALIVALAAHWVFATALARTDVVDDLMAHGRVSSALLAAGLLLTRLFLLFVAPGWLLSNLARQRVGLPR